MQLPKDENPTSVIYVYKNGSRYECAGKELKKFRNNLAVADTLCWSHGVNMEPVKWKKL